MSVSGILAYTPIGCGSPLLTGPAAPNLLSTGCFALFSSSGPVSNAGITVVTGDVGTNSGLTTGYNPLFVNGMVHPVPDGTTTQAASDLLNVYNYLNTLPSDIELLYPPQFGNSLVLTPHKYIMNGAVTFTDSLFLNAEGDSNAVFVIQIKGALSTSTFSKVILINGAIAKNVYWVVDGAVSISDFSVFNGTIVCNNGAIALTTGVSISGRAMTTTGTVSTSSDSVHITSACDAILPISWIFFRGSLSGTSVLLSWATANELNNAFFTIEKSSDGSHFTTLTTVKAALINSASQYQYAFTDPEPYNVNFYRISQTDKDGRKSFFKVIQVMASQQFKAFTYVQEKHAYVQASGAVPGNATLELYSMDGKKIASKPIILTKETSLYTIDKSLIKGMYLIHIQSNGEKLYNGKIVVQ
ncbi:MAG: ice-binding family protein [Bacteroidota bacterium]|nr:ice-binding family protein [Bacteroidota bacterium]